MKVLKCGTATPSCSDAWTQKSSRLHSHLPEPRPRSWVIADTLASPRGSQCFRISALSEGHRGYTRISLDLCECPPLAFSLHCDPSRFRHSPKKGCMASVSPDTPRLKNSRLHRPVPSHPCHSRVFLPSPDLAADRRPSRRARSPRGWPLLWSRDPGENQTDNLCHQDGKRATNHKVLTALQDTHGLEPGCSC